MSWSYLSGTRPTFPTSGAYAFKDIPNRVCMYADVSQTGNT